MALVQVKENKKIWKHNKLVLERALAMAVPEITFRDKQGWEKNDNKIVNGIISFAEQWARLMESQIADGDTLENCAWSTYHIVYNVHQITGPMFQGAISILSQVWIHGKQLCQWHNLETLR